MNCFIILDIRGDGDGKKGKETISKNLRPMS